MRARPTAPRCTSALLRLEAALSARGLLTVAPTRHDARIPTVVEPDAWHRLHQEVHDLRRQRVPLSQREQYGSFDWYVSMNRRNRVEGFFGNLKDKARENLTRGTIRVMGLVKTGLLVAMAVASLNLRLGEKWETTQREQTSSKKMGRPRKVGVAAYARAFAIAATGPPGA